MTQLNYFKKDLIRMLGKNKIRIIHIWLSRSFCGILVYRIERSLFLLLGNTYGIIRVPFIPIFTLLQAFSNIDIHYKADVKGGISILHASVGIVISGQSIIGENLTLTGGNVIGIKKTAPKGSFVIGDNCTLGANATIIGPVILGNKISIGSCGCVVKDCLTDNTTLIGVPANEKNKKNPNKIGVS